MEEKTVQEYLMIVIRTLLYQESDRILAKINEYDDRMKVLNSKRSMLSMDERIELRESVIPRATLYGTFRLIQEDKEDLTNAIRDISNMDKTTMKKMVVNSIEDLSKSNTQLAKLFKALNVDDLFNDSETECTDKDIPLLI